MRNYLFIASAAILASSNASADESLDSIFFKPKTSEFVSKTSYQYSDRSLIDNLNDKQEFRRQSLKQELSFGFTDKLHLDFGIAHVNENNKDIDDVTGQFSNINSNGITNPEIALTYRFTDQINNGFFSDLKLLYSPAIINAKYASYGKGGNVASDGDEYEIMGSYGMSLGNFSFKVDGAFKYFDDMKTEEMFDNTYSKANATHYTKIGITGQYSFNERISFNASLSHIDRGSHNIDHESKNVGGNEIDFGSKLSYSIIPNKALISLSYNFINTDNLYFKEPSGTTNNRENSRNETEISFTYKF